MPDLVERDFAVEDLPGAYSLDPISIDEAIVADRLDPDRTNDGALATPSAPPDGLLVTMDATVLRRSLGLLAQVLQTEIPTCVVVTFTDELARRHGTLDVDALRRALGVPVVAVVAGRNTDLAALRALLSAPREWAVPPVLPPTATREVSAWVGSVLTAARYEVPQIDERTRKVDAVLLHPVWGSCTTFLQKIGKIILATTMVLWLLLNLPSPSTAEMTAAGIDTSNDAATSEYVLDNSYAADVGKFVEPVFEPLGFDWRINIGVVASLAARDVFVATLGQVAAAEDPEDPSTALEDMTVLSGPRAGQPLFTPAVVAALLAFFIFALQCVSTIAVLRRESGS